jgi:anti-sigma regulatory factor (Ser/Thr protein kinase)
VTVAHDAAAGAFEHDAFVYGSHTEYVDVLAPLADAAVRAGDHVVAVVPEHNAELLRSAFGPIAGSVTWVAAEQWYRQPARTIAGYDRTLSALSGQTAFVIGEVQFGKTDRDWADWTRYEATLNRVLHRYPARVVCPYDERALPRSVVADARRTHPFVLTADGRSDSASYTEPERLCASLPVHVSVPEWPADVVLQGETSVRVGRQAFADAARQAGFADDRVHELAVGVSEVLTNAIVHGGGSGFVRMWIGDPLVCVIEDAGNGIDDPLLGMRPPSGEASGGYGLWYTRQVFDRTEVTRSPMGGLLVYLEASAVSGW